ncbi:MAG: DALR anticodon-binding domain-containing protein, partial [Acidobacteriota bacterium]|nr:DALR anticodon-binding domain-containing protein [Acidobacteriota bacterium]
IVFGFMNLEKKTLEDIQKIKGKFDYYCWDLYTKVTSYLESYPESLKRKSEILKKIEKGENPEFKIAEYVSRRIINAHLQTMQRLGISYDVLPCESSILRLKFWEKAFNLLKKKNAISLSDTGLNKGCWVMKLEDDPDKEKIIVRSDGTVTYVGKDIAYQLWKFGLLGKDFYYEPFAKQDGKVIWITSSAPTKCSASFGKGSLIYNVIDSRQSYLQKIVIQGLKSLKFIKEAENSIHFSYEMVALSPKSLKELDLELEEKDSRKSFLEVSGRKGLGVKADDLLDRLEEKALVEVNKRNPQFSLDQKSTAAHKIACGALRYFMLKFTNNSLIIFDFDEALNFEGETGVYLQYTSVRINSIFRKLKEREGVEEEKILSLISPGKISFDDLPESEMSDFWDIVLQASKLDEEVLHSICSLEFSHLAKYSFNLCQKINAYYHKYQILSEENREIKNIRILTIYYLKKILNQALSLMGIPQLERM